MSDTTNSIPKNLCGGNIRKLRTKANMTIAELASQIAEYDIIVDEYEIARIEARQSAITDRELLAFSKIFAITPENLIHTTM